LALLNIEFEHEANVLEGNNMVTRLNIRDAFANRLNDTSAFVSQDDRKGTLWVFPAQSVCIYTTVGQYAARPTSLDCLLSPV